MKKSLKITLCGIITALSVVMMLVSYFPYLTYSAPAIAGLFSIIPLIEIDKKWAAAVYLLSSVLVLITAEPESKLLYVCFFGFYPIVKALIEKVKFKSVARLLKLAVFNAAIITVYLLLAKLFSVPVDEFGEFGKYGVFVFWAVGNATFILYDYLVSKMALIYIFRIKPKTDKILFR